MLVRMLELDMQIDEIVFADTKLEFPELYDYIDLVEKYIGRPITRLKTDDTFDNWFYGKVTRGKHKGKQRGFPLSYYPCYWSRESKFKMLEEVCKDNIRYIGIATDEQRRIGTKEGYVYPLDDWGWTEQDCLDYLQSKGLHNKLYDRFDRLGCYLCPKQNIKSLTALYNHYPDLWEKLKEYERNSSNEFKPNFRLEKLENKLKGEDKNEKRNNSN